MGVKETGGGPGSSTGIKHVSKSKSGMFKRDIKTERVNKNPGPAHYFQNGIFDSNSQPKKAYEFTRKVRTTIEDQVKPDYDGSAFYEDKGPGVKPKIRGAMILNTTNEDHTVDRTKKHMPGVATYSDAHAFD